MTRTVVMALLVMAAPALAQKKDDKPAASRPAAPQVAPVQAVAGNQMDQITPDFYGPKSGADPKHVPKITAPDEVTAGEWFDVTVEIGEGARHPSMIEHFVQWIALYKDEVEISRVYLHPVYQTPKITFTITVDPETKALRAVEAPNHTGHWTAVKAIKVKAPAAAAAAPAPAKAPHSGH